MAKIGSSILDFFKDEILDLYEKGVSISSIRKIINPKLPKKLTYTAYFNYIKKFKNIKE